MFSPNMKPWDRFHAINKATCSSFYFLPHSITYSQTRKKNISQQITINMTKCEKIRTQLCKMFVIELFENNKYFLCYISVTAIVIINCVWKIFDVHYIHCTVDIRLEVFL